MMLYLRQGILLADTLLVWDLLDVHGYPGVVPGGSLGHVMDKVDLTLLGDALLPALEKKYILCHILTKMIHFTIDKKNLMRGADVPLSVTKSRRNSTKKRVTALKFDLGTCFYEE